MIKEMIKDGIAGPMGHASSGIAHVVMRMSQHVKSLAGRKKMIKINLFQGIGMPDRTTSREFQGFTVRGGITDIRRAALTCHYQRNLLKKMVGGSNRARLI